MAITPSPGWIVDPNNPNGVIPDPKVPVSQGGLSAPSTPTVSPSAVTPPTTSPSFTPLPPVQQPQATTAASTNTVPPEYAALGITPQEYAQLSSPNGMEPVSYSALLDKINTKLSTNNELTTQRNMILQQLYGTDPLTSDMLAKLPTDQQAVVQSGNKAEMEFQVRLLNDQISGRANTINQSIQYLTQGYQQAEQQRQDSLNTILNYSKALGQKPSDVMRALAPSMLAQMPPSEVTALDALGEPMGTKTLGSAKTGYYQLDPDGTVRMIIPPAGVTNGSGGGTTFTDTQINKGAVNANMSVSVFNTLDPDTQNFFINNKAGLDSVKTEIDAAAQDPAVDWDALGKEIDGSDLLPDEAKNLLWDYLNKARSKSSQSTATSPSTRKWYNPTTWF